MGLDLAFEEVVTAEEIVIALKINEGELADFELKGLPFIEVETGHLYLTSSILAFLKKVEISDKAVTVEVTNFKGQKENL
jgi:hypothetical protein